jgi:hypothetical protein
LTDVQYLRRQGHCAGPRNDAAGGQNAKYSPQADAFRFAPELGHCAMHPALRLCANEPTSQRLDRNGSIKTSSRRLGGTTAYPSGTPAIRMALQARLASRRNQVEHCFGLITKKRIRRGVLRCVDQRQAAISESFEHRNASPKPFVRSASAAGYPQKGRPAGGKRCRFSCWRMSLSANRIPLRPGHALK